MKHKILSTFIFLFISCIAFAQQKTITGLVKDGSDGSGLFGVTIGVKGTSIGTTTDDNGSFSLNVSVGDSIEFRLLGKKPQTIAVGSRNVYEVTMYDDFNALPEVAVVAFGTQKKQSVVAAITAVKVSDLRIPGSNLTAAIAGKIPGIISYQTSGEPGKDNSEFFVRGVTTFGYKSEPLYLIDGFEVTKDDFARLQLDDIESFSVLKDAAATVLYGSRAANGIIIVETKKGVEGPVKLSIRIDNHVATPTKIPKLADGVTYMRMYNEALMTRDPLVGAYYSEQKIQSTLDGTNPMIYPNINWYDAIFNDYAINTKANINVSGGGTLAKFFVSGGYDHETGLLKVDEKSNFNTNISINRAHLRSNVNFKLTGTTTLETQVYGRFERQTGPRASTEDIFGYVMNSNPVDFPAVYTADEKYRYVNYTLFGNTYVDGGRKTNPYAEMVRGYRDRNESKLIAQATLKQDLAKLTPGLAIQIKAAANVWSQYTMTREYNPFYFDLESYNQITGEHKLWCLNPTNGQIRLGDVQPGRNAEAQYYFEARGNWARQFDKHSLAAMLVGMADERLLTSGQSNSIYETLPEKNAGLSGRFSYDYDTRYFVEMAFGYNGSEKFDAQKRFGFYPSLALGWLVSNESFWEPIKDIFSTFKLKYSVGKMGNDAISGRAGRFYYLSQISIRGTTEAYGGGYRWGEDFMNSYGGYTISRYANPNITWELSTKWNAGLEAYFLKDNLKIQLDKFAENRTQIYMTRENFPSTAGLQASVSGNVGQMKAWGWDGSIDYVHRVNNDFWVEGRFNFTWADNKYTVMDEKNYTDKYLSRLGYNKDQWWGLIAERLFVDQQEINNSPKQDWGNYLAGDIKYKDINGDGKINDNDRVPLGYPTKAKLEYGFGLSMQYKKVDFAFHFKGSGLVSFFIHPGFPGNGEGTQAIAPFLSRRNALEIVAKDYWSETNPNVYAFWPRLSATPVNNNVRQSSWWLRDGSMVRLQQIELGYNANNISSFQKIGLQNLRVYVSVENLLSFSKFDLWDTELRRDGLKYPINRRFNLGLNLNF